MFLIAQLFKLSDDCVDTLLEMELMIKTIQCQLKEYFIIQSTPQKNNEHVLSFNSFFKKRPFKGPLTCYYFIIL